MYYEHLQALAEKWDEEGSEAIMNGEPRRGWYLSYMAGRLLFIGGMAPQPPPLPDLAGPLPPILQRFR